MLEAKSLADEPPFELRLLANALHRVVHVVNGRFDAGTVHHQPLRAAGAADAHDANGFSAPAEQPRGANKTDHVLRSMVPQGRQFGNTTAAEFIHRPNAVRIFARYSMPYEYGTIVCMKKTLHIDADLLRDAKSASGAKTDTDTVRFGLEALVRRGAYERLRALRGSEPRARDVRRRRQTARPAKHSAA